MNSNVNPPSQRCLSGGGLTLIAQSTPEFVELEIAAMKRKEAIDQLREIQEISDLKVAHRLADDVLCRLVHSLGYGDVVAEYNKVGKWYDSQ